MKDGRSDCNRVDHGLEDKVNTLLYKFDIKCEVFSRHKLNEVNCRRLMKHHVDIINNINGMINEASIDEVSDVEISKVTNKYINILKEIDYVYRCIRTLFIDKILIDKIRFHIQNTIIYWEN